MFPRRARRSPRNLRGQYVRDFTQIEQVADYAWNIPSNFCLQSFTAPTLTVTTGPTWSQPISVPLQNTITFPALALPPTTASDTLSLQKRVIDAIEVEIFLIDFVHQSFPCFQNTGTISIVPRAIGTSTENGTLTTVLGVGVYSGTDTFTFPIFDFHSSDLSEGIHFCYTPTSAPVLTAAIGLQLYVAQWNNAAQFWDVRRPFDPLSVMRDDLLDYAYDVYVKPTYFEASYTGRGWSLDLPYPIVLGSGQALCVSLANGANFDQSIVPYIRVRSRISA